MSLSEDIFATAGFVCKVDPKTLNDERAIHVSWAPSRANNYRYPTHKFQSQDESRIVYVDDVSKRSPMAIVGLALGSIGILIGLIFLSIVEIYTWIILGASGVFFIVSLFFLGGKGTKFQVFEKDRFYLGPTVGGKTKSYLQATTDKIYAIQIVNTATGYELFAVYSNIEREPIFAHMYLDVMRKEAVMLSKFYNVPVWDGTGEPEGSKGTGIRLSDTLK